MYNIIYLMNNTTNTIIGNLLRTPLESKSLHQIATETKVSYVTVHKVTPILLQRKILKMEKKGKSHLISIDFENAPIHILSSALLQEKEHFLQKHPALLILSREIEEKLTHTFYIFILFGSYAKGTEKKLSDIDLLFIVPSNIEKYRENIDKAIRLLPGKKHIITVTTNDFIDMLNQKHTVGREAFKDGIVLFGTEQYYAMVKQHVRTHGY